MRWRITARIVSIIFIVSVLMFAIACSSTNRIVIDGNTSQQIANYVIDSAVDCDSSLRGNIPSNLRNGAYVLQTDEEHLYYTTTIQFDDGTTFGYLYHLPSQAIGNDFLEFDILAELNGPMLGSFDSVLIYIDVQNNKQITACDLTSFETTTVTGSGISSAHLFDGALYYSYHNREGLFRSIIGAENQEQKLYHSGGIILSVCKEMILAYADKENHESLVAVSLNPTISTRYYSGHTFEDAEAIGSWIFFTENGYLFRMGIDGSLAIKTYDGMVDSYAIADGRLAISSSDKGILLGKIDGTNLKEISKDRASGLSMIGKNLFYINHLDDNSIYVYDMENSKRSRLQGDTLPDGGLGMTPIEAQRYDAMMTYYGSFVEIVRDLETSVASYTGTLQSEVLFVEFEAEANMQILYSLPGRRQFTPDKVNTIVLIRQEVTLLGYNTDGSAANRLDTTLTVFRTDVIEPLFKLRVEGKPPTLIKHGEGDRLGLTRSWHQKAFDFEKDFVVYQ